MKMEEYYVMRNKLEEMENAFSEELAKILESNDLPRTLAWLKFERDGLIVIWENNQITPSILNKLQTKFGLIKTIATNGLGGLAIKFDGVDLK